MRPEQPENPEEITGFSDDPGSGAAPGPGTEGSTDPAPDGVPEHATRAEAGDALLARALALVRHLRAHCPWDARQTPRSLRPYLLEVAHETADAVLAGDDDELAGELGDLLLNVAFQVVLGEERGAFDAPEVVGRLEAKMRDRHPHVYGDAEDAPDWEELKARERTTGEPPHEGVPDDLTPLIRALRVQQRAAEVGFDWPDARGAVVKLKEELDELQEELEHRASDSSDPSEGDGSVHKSPRAGGTVPDTRLEEEAGDLLFSAVNVVRKLDLHPKITLTRAIDKFVTRFQEIYVRATEERPHSDNLELDVLQQYWDSHKDK